MPAYILNMSVSPAGVGVTSPAVGTYSVDVDTIVSVTATPYAGYEFDHWDIDGDGMVSSYSLSSFQFSFPGPVNLVANFIVEGSRPSIGTLRGSQKSASILLSNPVSAGFDYVATLFLGVSAVAISVKSFHLNANESKSVIFPIVMPAIGALYPVYLSIKSGEQDLTLYRATDDLLVVEPTALMIALQASMEELAYDINTWGPREEWWYVPGYGLTGSVDWGTYYFMQSLLIAETIRARIIDTESEAHFSDHHYYLTDGTLIV